MKNGEQPINSVTITDQVPSITHLGLTKREYFAAMAMQAVLSNNRELESLGGSLIKISKHCIEMADILLLELDKTKSE